MEPHAARVKRKEKTLDQIRSSHAASACLVYLAFLVASVLCIIFEW